jgi:hypothetical protein
MLIVRTHEYLHAKLIREKSSTCLTFARWPHQRRSAVTPRGKFAALAFVDLDSWSEHDRLILAKRETAGKREVEAVVKPSVSIPAFIEKKIAGVRLREKESLEYVEYVAGKKWRKCGGGKKWQECGGGKK